MMVRPQDRGKVAALVGGIVLMLVVFAFRMHSVMNPDPGKVAGPIEIVSGKDRGKVLQPGDQGYVPPTSQTTVAGSDPVAATSAPTTAATTGPAPAGNLASTESIAETDPDEVDVTPKVTPIPIVDPFREVIPKKQPPAPPVTSKPRPEPMAGNVGTLPALTVGLPNPIEDKSPKPTVSGVMPGPNAVAVVKLGDDSYVVKVGDHLIGGYTVLDIRDDEVVLKKGNDTSFIKLSG